MPTSKVQAWPNARKHGAQKPSKTTPAKRHESNNPTKPTRQPSKAKAQTARKKPTQTGALVDSKGGKTRTKPRDRREHPLAVAIDGAPQTVVANALVRGLRGSLAQDNLWEENGHGSLSPFLDVVRGLGRETEGVVIREPRVLSLPELTALGHDGIARNVFSIKVEQAMAPGQQLQLLGVAPEHAAEITKRATERFIALDYEKTIRTLGIMAMQYGDAIMLNSYTHDRGVDDLHAPLEAVRFGSQRWSTPYDKRDFMVNGIAGSRTRFYRSASWIDLCPYNGAIDIDRVSGGGVGFGRTTGDTARVHVHPSRYIRLTTNTGYSILQECAQYIANLLLAAGGGAALMQRASAGVFEVEDWESQLFAQGSNAQQKLQAQFDVLGSRNAMILGKGEKFTWANLTISGIEGGIYSSAYLLSAATRTPMVYLLGASPGSFVSGASQTVMWHQVLDGIRKWLEPAFYRAWDNCLAEVTGGVIPDYELAWGEYEPPDTGKDMERKTQALELAAAYEDKGYISKEAAIAGLNTTEGNDFDVNSALAVPRTEAPQAPKTEIEVGKMQSLFAAIATYQTTPGLAPGPFRAAVRGTIPELAAEVDNMFPDRPVTPAVPGAPAPIVPGAPDAPANPLTPQAPAPGAGAGVGSPPAGPGEAWRKPREIRERYSIGHSTLVSMRTPLPGMPGSEGQIEWLQTPAGHARYRESDVLRLMQRGRIKAAPPEELANEQDEEPETDVAGAPNDAPARKDKRKAKDTTGITAGDAIRRSKRKKRAAPVQKYVWRTQHDDKVRPEHADREGKEFSVDSPPPDGNPGQPYNCRCWMEWVDGEDIVMDRAPMEGWPIEGVPWHMERVADESGISGTGIVVRGLALCDGSVVSWWCTEGLPPRPHVDSDWSDFYTIHIAQHPDNGTVVRQRGPNGEWYPVENVELGPRPMMPPRE